MQTCQTCECLSEISKIISEKLGSTVRTKTESLELMQSMVPASETLRIELEKLSSQGQAEFWVWYLGLSNEPPSQVREVFRNIVQKLRALNI